MQRLLGGVNRGADCSGDAKVDHARSGAVISHFHQDVRWLEVAVDEAGIVGVLYPSARADQQAHALVQAQAVGIGVLGDASAAHEFHREVRPAIVRRSGVKQPRNIGMVEHRQGLPLCLEAIQDVS